MKVLLNKFRIDGALDKNQPLPDSIRRKLDRSPRLRAWTDENRELNSQLRESVPVPPAPENLQADILRAVRRESGRPRVRPCVIRFAWLPIPATALVLLIGWALLHWAGSPTLGGTRSVDSTSTVLELSNRFAHSAPDVLLSPMVEELERLNRDLNTTAQFLLANLP